MSTMDYRAARRILGVADDCSPADVKKAYRRVAMLSHPDVGGDTEKFKIVKLAFDVLEGRVPPGNQSGSDASSTDWDIVFASTAMAYLGVDPEMLGSIESICEAWADQVADIRSSARRQLLLLFIGRVPIGAAISVVKTRKYKATGDQMLKSLDRFAASGGLTSVENWMAFGGAYVSLLKLVEQKAISKVVDLAQFREFLDRLHYACKSEDETKISGLIKFAERTAEAYLDAMAAQTPKASRTSLRRNFRVLSNLDRNSLGRWLAIGLALLCMIPMGFGVRAYFDTKSERFPETATAYTVPDRGDVVAVSKTEAPERRFNDSETTTSSISLPSVAVTHSSAHKELDYEVKGCWFVQLASTSSVERTDEQWPKEGLVAFGADELVVIRKSQFPSLATESSARLGVIANSSAEAEKVLIRAKSAVDDSFITRLPVFVCANAPLLRERQASSYVLAPDVFEAARESPVFNVFVSLVEAADLSETLQSGGPFFIFAPTDSAFERLPTGALDALFDPNNKPILVQILKYHLVSAQFSLAEITTGAIGSMEGSKLDLFSAAGKVTVNGANISNTELLARNGFLVGIDAVLAPEVIDIEALLVNSKGSNQCLWSTELQGVAFCNGKAVFDGGGSFVRASDEMAFLKFAKSGSPVEFDLTAGSSGFLRWPTGACVYQHGAGGNWTMECGSESEIKNVVGSYVFGEATEDSDSEAACVNRRNGAVEVIAVGVLGAIYPNEVCELLGSDWTEQ
jgi:uncharacterized surface protein with fasciclin (FAS1) repeats